MVKLNSLVRLWLEHQFPSLTNVLVLSKNTGPDFALYFSGARIITSRTSSTVHSTSSGTVSSSWGRVMGRPSIQGSPENILFPGLYEGLCWEMEGSSGQVGIKLSQIISVRSVTVDHISQHSAFDLTCAPREVEVWVAVTHASPEAVAVFDRGSCDHGDGECQGRLGDPLSSGAIGSKKRYANLFTIIYNPYSPSSIQNFAAPRHLRELNISSSSVIFRVLGNWGSEHHTCVYRFRVHGIPVQ